LLHLLRSWSLRQTRGGSAFFANEIKGLHRWSVNDLDTDALVVLAKFVLEADSVLQIARKQAGIPSLPEDESGISYIREWLPIRLDWRAKRDAERLKFNQELSEIFNADAQAKGKKVPDGIA
jgi:hypothetical protein